MSTNPPMGSTRVTLLPSGKHFDVPPNRSLLNAGLSAGIALPFGCADGTCGDCRARVCDGDVLRIRPHDFSLTESEKLNGVCLLCSYSTVTDAHIEVIEATSVGDIPIQQLPARLCRLDSVGVTLIATFKFSRGKALRFLPGQRAQLTYGDGFSIELPIASCPCSAHALEFHLTRDHPSADMISEFASRLSAGSSRERVIISGPVGHFTLSKQVRTPKLFVVTGGEFAQMQGMIEQIFNLEQQTPCCLIWKSSADTDHYQHNLCRSWQDAFDEFQYVPLDINDDALNSIPANWLGHLKTAEIYLGTAENQIVEGLMAQGVQANNLYYPEPPAD